MKTIKIGIIGGGLMGKEAASAFGRWFALNDFPAQVALTAVCDLNEKVLDWYTALPTVTLVTTDYKELLQSDLDVVYVALPHNLHKDFYLEVLAAGKDLLAEKPFGIDLEAALAIKEAGEKSGRFVRCSSEMPFLPGPQRVIQEVRSGRLGKIIEIKAGFLHSSDLDPNKPINWKRQSQFCGEIGVMGDLGMHALHVPLRLGWKPKAVYAYLQKIIEQRPDGKGGMADCDTWNNATLNTQVDIDGATVPMLLEMKRLSPGETNTWYIEVYGTEGGVKYSTKDTKALWTFARGEEQFWQRTDLGFKGVPFPTITGGIFEPGFADCFMQMLAGYIAEREGFLNGRFGCVTPEEAVASQYAFDAALRSHKNSSVEPITYS
ncbi:Gfo/Idh/MocA family protein [Mucilaginibacter myungsuensis]|uniref:Gfo/Idh/MocA family oxidoreductase n=1 Tax=Mucilaginibacter myungsuensis TaxID=649104 RepID=A0A929KUP8_9SPHI|nr:Gfo/Idh/MocA family oxidoreductase [Mucilaginibacter myungsuensis]MBE9660790.1 Gfo/Idh/MocA family oxidoreductase [Mucilaginibacter myungsuensis]MDN3600836.1 Gfo/Idh/MocA family oxidoreductase [Mucilaginibacter myungsuensis]